MESINLATREGLQKYLQNASLAELQDIASQFKLVFNELPGETTGDKSNELIAYIDRRKLLPELTLATMRSHITKQLSSEEINTLPVIQPKLSPQSGLDALSMQLNSLQGQVQELRRTPTHNSTLENKLEELARTADTANKLTASVVLPSAESMVVRLAPIHQLDRLQEYQSDENWAFLAIGTFAGAVMGILTNAANNENFSWTKISIFLLCFFSVITIVSIIWTYQLTKRTKKFIAELNSNTNYGLTPNISEISNHE